MQLFGCFPAAEVGWLRGAHRSYKMCSYNAFSVPTWPVIPSLWLLIEFLQHYCEKRKKLFLSLHRKCFKNSLLNNSSNFVNSASSVSIITQKKAQAKQTETKKQTSSFPNIPFFLIASQLPTCPALSLDFLLLSSPIPPAKSSFSACRDHVSFVHHWIS